MGIERKSYRSERKLGAPAWVIRPSFDAFPGYPGDEGRSRLHEYASAMVQAIDDLGFDEVEAKSGRKWRSGDEARELIGRWAAEQMGNEDWTLGVVRWTDGEGSVLCQTLDTDALWPILCAWGPRGSEVVERIDEAWARL